MWSLNWGVFWAIVAAFAVRAVWVTIWGELLGQWAPTCYRLLSDLSVSLAASSEKLTEANRHLARLGQIEKDLYRIEEIEKSVSRLEEIEENAFHLHRLEQIEKDVSEIAIHLGTQSR
jgi:hypothetical protein